MITFVPWSGRATTDDAGLVRRVAAGDRAALEAAYRREADAVYRFALALCGNPAWAADATQDAFLALAGTPQHFDAARGTLGAWLAGVARHALLAQWRRASAAGGAVGRDDDIEADEPAHVSPPPEALLVSRQSTDALWASIRALPWVLREAVVLVDLQERPYAEAAAIAGVPLNTLRTRLHRGRARLAALLSSAERPAATIGDLP